MYNDDGDNDDDDNDDDNHDDIQSQLECEWRVQPPPRGEEPLDHNPPRSFLSCMGRLG